MPQLQRERGHVTGTWQNLINFAIYRCTILYGSYMPSPPLGSIAKPLVIGYLSEKCSSSPSHIQFGLTPSQTGLLFLTISVPYIIFASVGGQLADKIVRSVYSASIHDY